MGQAQRNTEDAAPGLGRNGKKPNPYVMFVPELAARLGISVETFYRTRGSLHADKGLPPSLTRNRPFRFNRQKIEAWLNRDRDIPAAANDAVAIVPQTDIEHQQRLAIAYGGARG